MSEAAFERAVRALGENYDGYADPNDTPRNWRAAVEGVRVVLLAIREPDTEAIIAAQHAQANSIQASHVEGVSVDLLNKFAAIEPQHATAMWLAMIDHLLAASPRAAPVSNSANHP